MICKKLFECMEGEFSGNRSKSCDNANRSACIESSDNRSMVRCEEKKKRYVLINEKRNHVIHYKMDGGIIVTDRTVPEETNKCDRLFVVDDGGKMAILIELKGTDLPKAMKQIENTLTIYRDFFGSCSKVYGRIVGATGVPKLRATPGYVNLSSLLHKYGGNLKMGERQLEEKDQELNMVK